LSDEFQRPERFPAKVNAIFTLANAMKVFLVAAIMLVAGWWIWSARGDTFRYRLTVAVESNGEIYTGSGVIEVKMHFQEYWSPPALPRVTGDAVVVEVPGRDPIFVLLTAKENVDWDASIAFKTFQDRFPMPRTPRGDTRVLAALREKAEIPAKWYPILVAFGDASRPASVYEVNASDSSRALGVGSRVVRMSIEMTDEPVTYAVDKILPWVSNLGGYLDGEEYSFINTLAGRLSARDFRKRQG
jgi:hypothetical protein